MSIDQIVSCKCIGNGPDLVLIHGWGVSKAVWNPIVEGLSQHFRLHLIDIPGFGDSAMITPYTLDNIALAILKSVPENAIWCGWSLGGLIATHAAHAYPDKIDKLIQVCSPIKFVSDDANDGWQGVEAETLALFKEGVKTNPSKTLVRFMNLQASGSFTARKDVLLIKKQLLGEKLADPLALLAGLDLLSESDLRDEFTQIKQDCLSIFGRFDSLVPIEASTAMHALQPNAKQVIFELSSHAPFITEQDHFCDVLIKFGALQ